jgi:hypothetical protein
MRKSRGAGNLLQNLDVNKALRQRIHVFFCVYSYFE